VIRGRVVAADTGLAIAGARISSGATGIDDVFSDNEGRFELRALPARGYLIVASRSGFVAGGFGQRRRGDGVRPIQIAPGQVFDGVDIALSKGGVIAGVVLDRFGEPLPRAPVVVFRRRFEQGERRLIQESSPRRGPDGPLFGVADLTDDRGAFRLFGLLPGVYYVAAGEANPQARSRDDVPYGSVQQSGATFYPGTATVSNAQAIVLSEGQEVAGLSFAVVPVSSATIRGVARAADGRVPRSLRLLRHRESGAPSTETVPLQRDGSFAIPDLPPGRYTLFARDGDDLASTHLALGDDDVLVTLATRPGYTVRGQVVFAGGSPPPLPENASQIVTVRGEDGQGVIAATVTTDWTFEAKGILGRQRLGVAVPGWIPRRAERNGADITDVPFDVDGNVSGIRVLMTNRTTALEGAVRDRRDQPMPDSTVVIFAEDPARWLPRNRYHRRLQPDQNGRFTVTNLPAGRYLAVAVDYIEGGEDTNPDVLESLSRRATRVTLVEGETRTLALRVVELP
jgi:hypothetical protein